MSTRGYYGIKKKNELKGCYNHFDSYPSGLGKWLAESINAIDEKDRLKVLNDTFYYIELIDENIAPSEEQIEKCKKAEVVNLNVGNQNINDWYCLLRETQGNIDIYINKVVPYMINGNDFLEDDIFCEWGYIIDLDNNTFNVYSMGKNLKCTLNLLDLDILDILDLENYDEDED